MKLHVQRGDTSVVFSVSRAIQDRELALLYQPIVDLSDGKIVAVEALVRWHHPALGIVPPGQFLPSIVHDADLRLLDLWVLTTAAREIGEMQRSISPQIALSVNVAPQHLGRRDCIAGLSEAIASENVDPSCLIFEITESAALLNAEHGIESITALQKLGVRFALDDFGTGFATLDCLATLPVDILKLDRRFLARHASEKDSAIISLVLQLAAQLGLHVVLEGVERRDELAFARLHDARYGQGFFLSRPVPVQELPSLLAIRRAGTFKHASKRFRVI